MIRRLCVISILGIELIYCGGCESKADRALEKERQRLIEQRVDILMAIPEECMDECRELEFRFVRDLNEKQQHAVGGISCLLAGQSIRQRVESIDNMVGLLTPGMLMQLAEHTEAQERMFRQYPEFWSKMESFKEEMTGYYNRLIHDDADTRADLAQAERFYRELKERVTSRRPEHLQELLHDLCNAVIVYENDRSL